MEMNKMTLPFPGIDFDQSLTFIFVEYCEKRDENKGQRRPEA